MAFTKIQEHPGKLHVEAVPSPRGVVVLRCRAFLMHGMCQLMVAVHLSHLHALAENLLLALDQVLWVHVRAGRSSHAGKEGLIGLLVFHDTSQALPSLLLCIPVCSMLPGPHSLSNVDVTCIHGPLCCIRWAHGKACGLHVANLLILERLVAETAHMALIGLFRNLGDLATEGFGLELAEVVVLHPVHGEQVTQAGTDILALHHGRITAIRSSGRLVCV